jgi:hypothetical protein
VSDLWSHAIRRHHIKFAEPRAMGRKVSDKFTCPFADSITANCTGMATKGLGGPLGVAAAL